MHEFDLPHLVGTYGAELAPGDVHTAVVSAAGCVHRQPFLVVAGCIDTSHHHWRTEHHRGTGCRGLVHHHAADRESARADQAGHVKHPVRVHGDHRITH